MGGNLKVTLGGMTFINTPNIIVGFGQPLIVMEPPEEPKAPFRLSAIFQDKSGKEIAKIVQNEWVGASDNWDIRTKGSEFTIRSGSRSIDLKINISYDELKIERLNMFYRGYVITCKNDIAILTNPVGGSIVMRGFTFRDNINGYVFG